MLLRTLVLQYLVTINIQRNLNASPLKSPKNKIIFHCEKIPKRFHNMKLVVRAPPLRRITYNYGVEVNTNKRIKNDKQKQKKGKITDNLRRTIGGETFSDFGKRTSMR